MIGRVILVRVVRDEKIAAMKKSEKMVLGKACSILQDLGTEV